MAGLVFYDNPISETVGIMADNHGRDAQVELTYIEAQRLIHELAQWDLIRRRLRPREIAH